MEAAVELQAAHKSYGRVEALRGVDIAIEPGELVELALLFTTGS